MSSLPKGKRHSNGGQCEDRITNLPCNLITKILSSLSTKDAVATCVLSTKWNRSWTSLTNLDFNVGFGPFYGKAETPDFYKKVRSLINRVLLLRDRSCLEKFRLKFYRDDDYSFVNAWLIYVVQCNVREIDISEISIPHPGKLASNIFICSTLVVLKLGGEFCVCIPNRPCLPALKNLHLSDVRFSDDESITRLLYGCPMLENLNLSEFVGKDAKVINITAHALKRLTIKYTMPYDFDQRGTASLVIDTPALEFFSFDDYPAEVYVVNKMFHLIRAEITFDYSRLSDQSLEDIRRVVIEEFLNGISQVKSLVLSWDTLMVMSSCDSAVPIFSRLTYLKVNTPSDPYWRVLPKLLEKTPYLKTLLILQGDADIEKYTLGSSLFHDVPSCFLFHLKEIEIESFEYCEGEMEVVEYILENAKVLEKLTLHYMTNSDPDDTLDCYKALISFPRASRCKVVVLSD